MSSMTSLAYDPVSHSVAAADSEGRISVWSLKSKRRLFSTITSLSAEASALNSGRESPAEGAVNDGDLAVTSSMSQKQQQKQPTTPRSVTLPPLAFPSPVLTDQQLLSQRHAAMLQTTPRVAERLGIKPAAAAAAQASPVLPLRALYVKPQQTDTAAAADERLAAAAREVLSLSLSVSVSQTAPPVPLSRAVHGRQRTHPAAVPPLHLSGAQTARDKSYPSPDRKHTDPVAAALHTYLSRPSAVRHLRLQRERIAPAFQSASSGDSAATAGVGGNAVLGSPALPSGAVTDRGVGSRTRRFLSLMSADSSALPSPKHLQQLQQRSPQVGLHQQQQQQSLQEQDQQQAAAGAPDMSQLLGELVDPLTAVSALVFMEHAGWRLLVAGCVDGNVRFYDTTNNGAQVFELQSLNQDAVSALACDGSNVLVLGTASGVMRVYDMRSLRIGPTRVQRGAFARTTIYAHDERILGLHLVSIGKHRLLVSCARKTMRVHTLDGVLVGGFGKGSWRIDDRSSYLTAAELQDEDLPVGDEDIEEEDADGEKHALSEMSRPRRLTQRGSLVPSLAGALPSVAGSSSLFAAALQRMMPAGQQPVAAKTQRGQTSADSDVGRWLDGYRDSIVRVLGERLGKDADISRAAVRETLVARWKG